MLYICQQLMAEMVLYVLRMKIIETIRVGKPVYFLPYATCNYIAKHVIQNALAFTSFLFI